MKSKMKIAKVKRSIKAKVKVETVETCVFKNGLAVMVNELAVYWVVGFKVYWANGFAEAYSPGMKYTTDPEINYENIFKAIRGVKPLK